MASTVSSNQIQFILNGTVQTGANWTVLNSGTSSNEVILNTPLQLNQVYNGTIIATDANNNSSTNTFTFNTWGPAPNNIYVEAADYNYGRADNLSIILRRRNLIKTTASLICWARKALITTY